MKPQVVLIAAAIFAVAACSASPQQGASAPGTYETVLITATKQNRDYLYKINVKTGAVWVHCCSTNNSDFVPATDASALPPGDYHLHTSNFVESDDSVTWNVYRTDSETGRTWVVNFSDQGAVSWQELSGTAQTLPK